mgnify:CR=1 FL=1
MIKQYVRYSSKDQAGTAASRIASEVVKDEDDPEREQLWYEALREILAEGIEKFPKSESLHLLFAFVYHEKLKKKYQALFEIMITKENKPSLETELAIYRLETIIEEEIAEYDALQTETKGTNVNQLVYFQNKFVEFQLQIEESVTHHLDFWRELLEDNPDIQKLENLGTQITTSIELAEEKFQKLSQINANSVKMLMIYGNYLKEISNDEQESLRILEKADYVQKNSSVNRQFVDNERLKYGENSNTCIVTLSAHIKSMGQIVNTNNEISRILGYAKSEVIGQNITKIQPKVFGEIHNAILENYFDNADNKVYGTEKLVFPVNKQGYIVPCTLMSKILPSLDEGLRLVGFLKEVDGLTINGGQIEYNSEEKIHYIVYGGESGTIMGLTASVFQDFGVPASLVYGNNLSSVDISIDIIIPDIFKQTTEDMMSQTGVILTIDTTGLQQNYQLGEEGSDNMSQHEEDENDSQM